MSAQPPHLPVKVRLGMEPLYFEQNMGQSDAAVHFLARGPGYTVFLTSTGATVRAGTALRMMLVGANPSAAPEAREPRAGRVHYLTETRMQTDVPTFGQVVYRDVYPGIDIAYHGKEGRLEYDFVVAPGSDPSAIRLSFLQGQTISHSRENGLTLRTPEGELRQPSPRLYQELGARQMEIDGEWIQTGAAEFGFRVGSYDRTEPLVIDPILLYSSFLGGSSEDGITSMVLDASGNIYVAGWTTSTDFPTSNAEQWSAGGGVDAFVTKLNPAGDSLVYSTYLGGRYEDRAFGIAVDSSGCAIITGWTYSPAFPGRNAAQPLFGGQRDAFVAKLTAAGNGLVFSTFLGGAGQDGGNGVAVDLSGNIYVVGDTSSVNFPTLNAYQRSNQGQQDAFVAKLGPTGTLLFSTYLGGSADDHGTAIALDAYGNIYLTGGTTSTNFPVVSALQSQNAGGQDAFVAKFNSTGSTLLYSTYLGGSGGRIGFPELGNAIAADTAGEACIAGTTSSTDFPVVNALQPSKNGASMDAFVAKLSASGAALGYATYLGGSGPDSGTALALDSSGNAYVAGYTASTDFPASSAIQVSNTGLYNAYAVMLSPTGGLLFGTYLGGEESSAAYAIGVNTLGDIYIAGQTLSYTFPTVNALNAQNVGGYGGFIAKIQVVPPTNAATFVRMSGAPSTAAAGQSFTVTIQFQNTGTTTWQSGSANPTNPYRLGAVGDNAIWGVGRVELPASQVMPGQTAVFTFTVKAPATTGSYAFSWGMLQEGVTWFGDAASTIITVAPPALPRAATLVGMSGAPSTATTGQIFTVTIQFQNTGTLTWQGPSSNPTNPYRLGAVADNTIWGVGRVELPSSQIAPGQTAAFTFTVTAPGAPGSYTFSWQMLQESVAWFGDTASTTLTVTSSPPPRAATLVGMTGVPSTVSKGQIFTLTIRFQNTGTLTWQNPSLNPSNPYRLGAVADNTVWGVGRVELPTSQIAPGQTAAFTFTVTAPGAAGSYAFSWQMLQEGVTWFGDTASTAITVGSL